MDSSPMDEDEMMMMIKSSVVNQFGGSPCYYLMAARIIISL